MGANQMLFEKINIAPEKKNVYLSAYIRDSGDFDIKRPAVIVLPGGGYMNCAFQEGEPVALRFAAMGYQAFLLKYSTLFSVFPSRPDFGRANPGVHYPGPMEDLGRAIIAIRENAERWCVDPDKIILCGFSAGAHLAAMYATHWNRPELSSALGVEASLLRPAACIYWCGCLWPSS
jgi:acetyl esterase/lipase